MDNAEHQKLIDEFDGGVRAIIESCLNSDMYSDIYMYIGIKGPTIEYESTKFVKNKIIEIMDLMKEPSVLENKSDPRNTVSFIELTENPIEYKTFSSKYLQPFLRKFNDEYAHKWWNGKVLRSFSRHLVQRHVTIELYFESTA